mmetsp:Transcript_118437/g.297872  ORF Transcript_118437/g.297872 Transcript_118437/m.297872 type:complete len:212 (-) Transcript_118437:277-912(-)
MPPSLPCVIPLPSSCGRSAGTTLAEVSPGGTGCASSGQAHLPAAQGPGVAGGASSGQQPFPGPNPGRCAAAFGPKPPLPVPAKMPAKIAFPSPCGPALSKELAARPEHGPAPELVKLGLKLDGVETAPIWPGRTGAGAPGMKQADGGPHGIAGFGYANCGGRAAFAAAALFAFARCCMISATLSLTSFSAFAICSAVPGPTVTDAGCPSFV